MHNPHVHAALMEAKTEDLRRAVDNATRARSAGRRACGSAHRRWLLRNLPTRRTAANRLDAGTQT
jgi:hypothetical protein